MMTSLSCCALDKAKRAGADGIAVEVFTAAVGHDADAPSDRFHSSEANGCLQVKDDSVVVGRVDVIDRVCRCSSLELRSLPLSSESKVHFTSRAVSGWPLWKSDAVMQMKDVG